MEETSAMMLPANHPLRQKLNDEVHARPPEELRAPTSISYLALFTDEAARQESWAKIHELAERFGTAPPTAGASHYSANLGPFRVKWEKHTEFTRYKFIVDEEENPPFSAPPIEAVPGEWLASLPGKLLVASNIMVVRGNSALPNIDDISARYFEGATLVGSSVSSGSARAFTDFRIHADGFSRIVVQDLTLTPRQAAGWCSGLWRSTAIACSRCSRFPSRGSFRRS